MTALTLDPATDPFVTRCNWVSGTSTSTQDHTAECTGGAGSDNNGRSLQNAPFEALLNLHTAFRLGDVQKRQNMDEVTPLCHCATL